MRQMLPADAPGPLYVSAVGHLEVFPGQEFDAPALVPGCVSLEAPAEPESTEAGTLLAGATVTAEGTPEGAMGDAEPQSGEDGTGPESADEDQPPAGVAEDQSRASARRKSKEPKP